MTAELVALCAPPVVEEKQPANPPLVAKPIEVSAQVGPKVGRPESGINKAARELGKPRSTVQRDLKIATITPTAEAAAIDAGLGDVQTALLRVAAEPLEREVEAVATIIQGSIQPFRRRCRGKTVR